MSLKKSKLCSSRIYSEISFTIIRYILPLKQVGSILVKCGAMIHAVQIRPLAFHYFKIIFNRFETVTVIGQF